MGSNRTSISLSQRFTLLAALCLGIACLGIANAEPLATASAWAGDDWELDFEPGPFRLYVDPANGESYWYFIYTVANRTDRDRMFAPKLELFSDNGSIHRAGHKVPSRVNKQIRQLLADPLLEDQNRIIGELLVGRENARSGLAVWPVTDISVTELTLFIAGLSSDALVIVHPLTKEPIRLQRTLRREYLVPGNPAERGSEPIRLEPRKNRRGPECEDEFLKGGCWIYR